jgi:hypothetical protein
MMRGPLLLLLCSIVALEGAATESEKGINNGGACNCSRQKSGDCAPTAEACLFGKSICSQDNLLFILPPGKCTCGTKFFGTVCYGECPAIVKTAEEKAAEEKGISENGAATEEKTTEEKAAKDKGISEKCGKNNCTRFCRFCLEK